MWYRISHTPSPQALLRRTPRLSYPATLRAPTSSSHAHQPSHTHAAKDVSASSPENCAFTVLLLCIALQSLIERTEIVLMDCFLFLFYSDRAAAHLHSHASPKNPTHASSSSHSPPAPATHGHQRRLKNPDWVIPEIEFDDEVMRHMPFHTPEGVWDNPWPTWYDFSLLCTVVCTRAHLSVIAIHFLEFCRSSS